MAPAPSQLRRGAVLAGCVLGIVLVGLAVPRLSAELTAVTPSGRAPGAVSASDLAMIPPAAPLRAHARRMQRPAARPLAPAPARVAPAPWRAPAAAPRPRARRTQPPPAQPAPAPRRPAARPAPVQAASTGDTLVVQAPPGNAVSVVDRSTGAVVEGASVGDAATGAARTCPLDGCP